MLEQLANVRPLAKLPMHSCDVLDCSKPLLLLNKGQPVPKIISSKMSVMKYLTWLRSALSKTFIKLLCCGSHSQSKGDINGEANMEVENTTYNNVQDFW